MFMFKDLIANLLLSKEWGVLTQNVILKNLTFLSIIFLEMELNGRVVEWSKARHITDGLLKHLMKIQKVFGYLWLDRWTCLEYSHIILIFSFINHKRVHWCVCVQSEECVWNSNLFSIKCNRTNSNAEDDVKLSIRSR